MTTQTLRYRIDGMDCGSCAAKIENALNRIDGVSGVEVNYMAERLTLKFAGSDTQVIESKIRSLGFTPSASIGAIAKKPAHDQGHAHRHDRHHTHSHGDDHGSSAISDERAWYGTSKGRLTIGIGLALAIVWAASFALPQWSAIMFSTAAAVCVVPFAKRALSLTFSGSPFSIELLMAVAAIGAILIGEPEEAAIVVFLFAVGELLENVAAGRARAGIKALIALVPRSAIVRREGRDVEVKAEDLALDDIIVVRPGDRIASDGEVVEGASDVDESPITGESVPVTKAAGAQVYAGSINTNAVLLVRVTRTAADNTIARIVHLVEEAQGSKAPVARFIDRFSKWYTPGAMAVSALVIVMPPLFLGADWNTWIYRGLALLLIACPCALVISTPAAIASGLSAGARRGLLIKGGAPLEVLGHLKTIAFDKTGTLTVGHPKVTDVIAAARTEQEVVVRAAAVERGSSHPLAKAVTERAAQHAIEVPKAFGATAIPGKGVTARLTDGFASVLSPRGAHEKSPLPPDIAARIRALEEEGKTVVVVTSGDEVDGLIAMRDEPRPDARDAIARLKELGMNTVMLTGDNARTGRAIAASLGLDVEAELLPQAKLDYIERLKRNGPVAMVGDGINDAPALAAASVGVAMGSGTDVALETADSAILQSRVLGIPELVELSRATLTNIYQNIFAALGLKGLFLITTLTGTTTLWMAILADTGATVLVTANAMRLLRWKN